MRVRDVLRPLVERAPFRVADRIRRARKAARGWWRHRRTGVYIVSFPGCGRTWLSMLIRKAYVYELGLEATEPRNLVELARRRRDVPRITITHDGDPQLKRPDELERDKRRFADKTVILLVRDPRDAVISYYFEGSKRRGRFAGSPAEFVRNPVGSIDTIVAYYNIWADNRDLPRRFLIVRYEDMKRDAAGELDRVMRALGREVPREALERAVEAARFDNMRKLELEGTGHRALARTKALDSAGDPEGFKTRKAKVGGYRDYLSDAEIADMNARIAATLSPFFADYLRDGGVRGS